MRGKVIALDTDGKYQKDHPRLCGEKRKNHKLDEWRAGSPPPMRGKVDIDAKCEYNIRITPAYAGKSVEI